AVNQVAERRAPGPSTSSGWLRDIRRGAQQLPARDRPWLILAGTPGRRVSSHPELVEGPGREACRRTEAAAGRAVLYSGWRSTHHSSASAIASQEASMMSVLAPTVCQVWSLSLD